MDHPAAVRRVLQLAEVHPLRSLGPTTWDGSVPDLAAQRMAAVLVASQAMTSNEDDYLVGLIEAAYMGGWLVHHDRRSDLGIQQGHVGFPDIVAAHADRGLVIAWEVKDQASVTINQAAWVRAFALAGVDGRVVRPEDYASAVELLLGPKLLTKPRRAARRGRI